MKLFTPKFYLSFGLASLLISVLMLAVFTGILPDRKSEIHVQRAMLAESIASSNSLFLQKNDFASIRSNLEFSVERNPQMLYARVERFSDQSAIAFGDKLAIGRDSDVHEMEVPLYRGTREWGVVKFYFSPLKGQTWREKIQRSTLAQVLFIVLLSLCAFYIYLGKMLKQLNPSAAVPARVRSALETIAESLIVVNRKGEIVLANTAFAELVKQQPEKLIGRAANAFAWELPEDSSGQDEPVNAEFPWIRTLESGDGIRGDMLWMEDAEGVRRKFIVNCSPVESANGKTGGVLISLDDVTLLEHKEVELLRSKEEAETANRAKSEFLSNMSHEIRTPMTAILGFTEILKRGYTRDEASAQKHLSTIGRSGKHLLELINDILDLSKVESGALSVESIKCEPHLLVHDVIQVLGVKATEKSISLQHDIPEALPEYIFSDPSRLRQIVTNLVGNAIKFTDQGGVTIVLRVVKQNGQQQLAIDVTDTGIGMSEEQVAGIFEAFVQADTTITRRFGGTGLGLSISRKLAQALGGDIQVTSTPGVGSTFTATLDAGAIAGVNYLSPSQVREATDNVEVVSRQHWVFDNKTVLVVDDAQENRDLLELLLSDMNIETVLVENGLLATEAVQQQAFDLVLMDIQMPVMDGFEASTVMRQQGFESPVVALTANAMKGFENELQQTGFSHYMTKPIDIDKLSTLLAELLDGRPAGDVTRESSALSGEDSVAANDETIDAVGNTQKFHNTLIYQNEKFRPLAERFMARLGDKLKEMQQAVESQDMATVASLAHWLKGSGGSVGFGALTEPAAELENAAKNGEADQVPTLFESLLSICSQLSLEENPVQKVHGISFDDDITSRAEVEAANADTPLISSLIGKGPQFFALVQRFIPRLRENLSAMEQAVEKLDYDTIAALAHWLKGSGGNVGFHEFTSPASELEIAAKNNNDGEIFHWFTTIKSLAERIEPPDAPVVAGVAG
ncbi:MAG: Hpt domain-containing protein [Gammaproteobacteria bacterium]|nr:Hpt domain-containing protein [Gammaproteobacteria bacterium]